MKFFKRIFGICETQMPLKQESWAYVDNTITIDLKKMPELSKPGDSVRLEKNSLPKRILVVYGLDGRFYAYENKCAHMGRRLDPISDKEIIQCCSVSKSTFTYSGDRISGEANSNLKTFNITKTNDKLVIKL